MNIVEGIHPEWQVALRNVHDDIKKIEETLEGHAFNPAPEDVFKALRSPISQTSVVIFGQDPYPNPHHAMGLAFSVPREVRPIPKTLANIFRELQDDIGCDIPSSGDLTAWADQGVALVNRMLTTPQGQSAGHIRINWQVITNEIARVLGERGTIAVLWGKHAQELTPYFQKGLVISSAHPSPLSAHRGFFGSRPFSKTNQLLASSARQAIDWSLD